jgi:adenylate kinase family enzyme
MTKDDLARISIVGTSCSGKTTFARNIANALDYSHIELDAIHWKPQWQTRTNEKFRALTQKAIAPDRWVLDGNYKVVRDIVWGRATTVIWLNYPFHIVWLRALSRTIRRVFDQKVFFSGNRETFRQALLSRDSILLWILKTYRRRRQEYPLLFQQPEYTHLQIIEFQHPKHAQQFLSRISQHQPTSSSTYFLK